MMRAVSLGILLSGLTACGVGGDTTGRGQVSPIECIPLEEGALYEVQNGRLTAAMPPEPRIIERVIEPELTWTERLEAGFPAMGFDWLRLDVRNLGAGVVILTGQAPDARIKQRGLEAGLAAIDTSPSARDLLVIDGVEVEDVSPPLGAPLSGLTLSSTVEECQVAFDQIMIDREISFTTAGASLGSESAAVLDAAAAIGRLCDDYEIEIGGHTDTIGNDLNNQRLSERRANAVRISLIDRGVDEDSLIAVGYGESQPLDESGSDAAQSLNRRTVFRVRRR